MPTLTQLRYLLAVHERGHFGRAAEDVGVSQPTLSAQIQRAEEELGVQILDRGAKPIGPTEKGRVLLPMAEEVVAAYDRMVRAAQSELGAVAGDLSLGVIPTLAPYVLPWFLRRFADTFPQVDLTIYERTTQGILDDLERRRLDVGLVALPLQEARMVERPIFDDPFYVYAHAEDPILTLDEVDPSELDPERVWLLEDGHCLRHQALSLCRRVEGCPRFDHLRFEAASLETLRRLVDTTSGLTLVPETFARELPKDVRRRQTRPFRDPAPMRRVGLVHPRSTSKTDILDALEATLRKALPRPFRPPSDEAQVLPVR